MKAIAFGLLVVGVVLALVLLGLVALRVLAAALIRRVESHGRDGL